MGGEERRDSIRWQTVVGERKWTSRVFRAVDADDNKCQGRAFFLSYPFPWVLTKQGSNTQQWQSAAFVLLFSSQLALSSYYNIVERRRRKKGEKWPPRQKQDEVSRNGWMANSTREIGGGGSRELLGNNRWVGGGRDREDEQKSPADLALTGL